MVVKFFSIMTFLWICILLNTLALVSKENIQNRKEANPIILDYNNLRINLSNIILIKEMRIEKIMIKNIIPMLLRYLSFISPIAAVIAILLKFKRNLQISYFQFSLFLIVYSCLINIAREKTISKNSYLYLSYLVCIIYALFIIILWTLQRNGEIQWIKVVLKDETILEIYVSKEKTILNTNQYINDRKIANEIGQIL